MPKKGQRLPYRVVFVYPGREPSTSPHLTFDGAEHAAAEIGRNGGIATIREVGQSARDLGRALALFGPDVFHFMDWSRKDDPTSELYCRCARRPASKAEADTHMMRAGLCTECWGTETVAQRATRDGGIPTAGNLIACPVCGGTGRDEDVSYHDVDRSAYYNRYEILKLTAAGPTTTR